MSHQSELTAELIGRLDELKRRMMRTREHMLGELQLTRTQIEILVMLAGPARTVGEIAQALAVSQSAATQTLATLEARAFIVRTGDPNDRRVVRVGLSEEGRHIADRLARERYRRLQGAFASLSPDELRLMITVLDRLMQQFAESPLPPLPKPPSPPPARHDQPTPPPTKENL